MSENGVESLCIDDYGNLFFSIMFCMVGYSQTSINESRKNQRIDQIHEKPIKFKKIVYKFKPINLEHKLLIY